MRFANLPEPAGFKAAVKADAEKIRAEILETGRANFDGRETWKRFKKDIAAATFGKCGYCEVNVDAVDRFKGDVEHYRPKGRVDKRVVEPDGTVKLNPLYASGYHWLAYSWNNYILTCNPCNSAHKRNFFPLRTEPAAPPAIGDERTEDPLLLNPFGRKDPAKHLIFDHLGIVGPRNRSPYGGATIDVCGLSRTPLEKKRRQISSLLQLHLEVLANAEASDETTDLAIGTIAELGMKDREHCGMVRSMFSAATGLPWSFVEQLAPRPEPVFTS
jgi:hypothetical protein